jgi:hypothetical protein
MLVLAIIFQIYVYVYLNRVDKNKDVTKTWEKELLHKYSLIFIFYSIMIFVVLFIEINNNIIFRIVEILGILDILLYNLCVFSLQRSIE